MRAQNIAILSALKVVVGSDKQTQLPRVHVLHGRRLLVHQLCRNPPLRSLLWLYFTPLRRQRPGLQSCMHAQC